jgi:hypothetical protein
MMMKLTTNTQKNSASLVLADRSTKADNYSIRQTQQQNLMLTTVLLYDAWDQTLKTIYYNRVNAGQTFEQRQF